MKSKKSIQSEHIVRWVKKYGDLPIIRGIFKGDFWKRVMDKDEKLVWDVIRNFVRFMTAMFANCLECIYRHKFGKEAHGIILSLCTTSFIIALNSTTIPALATPLAFWAMPVMVFQVGFEKSWEFVFEDVHSPGLSIVAVIYFILSIKSSVEIFIGRGNKHFTKRGESWLYETVFKPNDFKDDFLVQGIIEPFFTALVAWGIWALGDHSLALFLWFAASSLFIQEVMDKATNQASAASLT